MQYLRLSLFLIGLPGLPLVVESQVLVSYTFSDEASIDEWEARGSPFASPETWGDVRWTDADGHPTPGAMVIEDGTGLSPEMRAFGPCLPPEENFHGRLVELRGFIRTVELAGTCGLLFYTYSDVDDCSGASDGSIHAAQFTNPTGTDVWLPYSLTFVLDEPSIRSLRPVVGNGARAEQTCLVDSITISVTDISEVPVSPASLVGLSVLLAMLGVWYLSRGAS